jgi:hypothetical protein
MGGQRQEKNNLDDSAVPESITSQWWSFSSFVPLVTGALWLWLAASGGLLAVLLGAVPGALLLGTGLSGLLWAVESKTFQYMALASALGGSSHYPPSLSPVQARSLWRHWDEPRIGWYQGAHQRFIRASEGRKILEETLSAADMLPNETTGTASQR